MVLRVVLVVVAVVSSSIPLKMALFQRLANIITAVSGSVCAVYPVETPIINKSKSKGPMNQNLFSPLH